MRDAESRVSAIKRLWFTSLTIAGSLGISAIDAPSRSLPVRLQLASSANDDVTPVLYAQASGMFRQAGIDVDLQVISNGTAVAAAVAGGSVDLGRASILSVVSAHAHGVPLILVAPSGLALDTATGSAMIAVADGPIHSADGLDGKVVSVAALHDIVDVAVHAWIDKNGGHSGTIQFVELAGPQVGAALDAARIDAAMVVNPLMAQLLASGKYRSIGDPATGIASRYLVSAWFGTTGYVLKNPDAIRAFAATIAKASDYCNAHPQQTAVLLAKFTGIDLATIEHMRRIHFASALDPRDIQPVVDAAAKYQVISRSFNAREIIASY
jgi:NitT/TauT family transport system substrate-binding protein